MASASLEIQENGETVRKTVARLRREQDLTFEALSVRLERVGRRIPPLGLSRMERGERRVDADDLVALSRVLGVDVLTLLGLPPAGQEVVIERPEVVIRLQITAST